MKKDVITFILVDDHPVVRDGMEAMLLSEEDFDSFGTAADADEAIALVRAKPPDVVLTDVRMPKGDGFQLLSVTPRSSIAFVTVTFTPVDGRV